MQRVRRLALFAPLLLLLALASPRLLAEVPSAPATAGDATEGKKHFDVGRKLYDEKSYEGALTEFEQSYRLGGRPSALMAYAQCERDLKRFADAYEAYEAVLARHGDALKPKEKSSVQQALDELKLLIGAIDAKVEPEGTTISIDGKTVGTTPLAKPVRVNVGPHKLKATAPGREPSEKDVTVIADQTVTISFELVKEVKTGHVTVREDAGQLAHVVVDGVDVGLTPWEGELAPGSHVVQLKGDKSASESRTFEVIAKERKDVSLALQSLNGRLRVSVRPSNATIAVDGKAVGLGAWTGELSPGSHTLLLTAPDYEPFTTTLTIERGKESSQDVSLSHALATGTTSASTTAGEEGKQFVGAYARIGLGYGFTPVGKPAADDIVDSTVTLTATPDKHVDPIAGGFATIRAGYSFDPIGVEFVTGFAGFYQTATVTYQGPDPTKGATIDGTIGHKETFEWLSGGAFAGVGGRISSRDPSLRFTGGVAVGGVFRTLHFSRNFNNSVGAPVGSLNDSQSVNYFAPAIIVDASVNIGGTPDTRFFIGVEAWLEITGKQQTVPPSLSPSWPSASGTTNVSADGRSFTVLTGPALFIGPTLGLAFGH